MLELIKKQSGGKNMSVDILLIHQRILSWWSDFLVFHIREKKLPLIITLSYFITETAFRSVAEIRCGARGSKKVEVALQYLRL